MRTIRIAFLGYGTVGRALHELIEHRRGDLTRAYDLRCELVGIATRRQGWCIGEQRCRDIAEWLDIAAPDVVFESISLDPHTGQPALDYLHAILEHGAHAISANKGPLVHGYRELSSAAARRSRTYRFESAVMDGAPVFSLVRECLPLVDLRAIRGVFTSTATIVLEAVERGLSFDEGIMEAQQLGIAEADPAYDVDGWDSAVKLCALANVLMNGDLRPGDVARDGIRSLTQQSIRAAKGDGEPYRLIGDLERGTDGVLTARVQPRRCSTATPLGVVTGTTLVTHFDAEMFPGGLTITSRDPNPTTTAYGMFADMISALALFDRVALSRDIGDHSV